MMPHGFRFNPTDEELIQILERKVAGHEMSLPFILHTNVYEHEPQHLTQCPLIGNETTALVNKEERYYYCKRENDSREVPGRGWWKATSHVRKIYISENLVGYKRPLTFHRFKHYDNRDRTDAVKTNWLMHEYCLHSISTEWRLCKIKHKGKPSIQEEMESIKQSFSFSLTKELNVESSNYDHQAQSLVDSPANPSIMPIPTEPDYNVVHNHDQYLEDEELVTQGLDFDHFIDGAPSIISDPQENYHDQFPSLWSW